jgi:hypothetical protein
MVLMFHIIQIIILFSAFSCFINKKYFEKREIFFFYPFLLFTFLVQYVGYYYSIFYKKPNDWIFNLFGIIEYLFFFFFFYAIYINANLKKVFLFVVAIFLVWCIINLFFIQGFFFLNTYTDSVACLLILLCCGLYFRELLTDKNYTNIWKSNVFWIVIALFIYYIGQFVLIFIFPVLFKKNPLQSIKLYWSLMIPLNLLEYSLFTIGFYAARKR